MKSKNPKIQNLRKKALITVAMLLVIVSILLVVLECTNSSYKLSNLAKEEKTSIVVGEKEERTIAYEESNGTITVTCDWISGTKYYTKPVNIKNTKNSGQYSIWKEGVTACQGRVYANRFTSYT